jgi:uncharacterized protein (DUF2147 family)
VVGRMSLCLFVALTSPMMALAAAAPNVFGAWARVDGSARIKIEPCGAWICATNTWVQDTSNGEAIGDQLIMTLRPESVSVLSGEAFDEKRDKTYTISITLKQANQMTTRGCVLAGLICKSEGWTRLQ